MAEIRKHRPKSSLIGDQVRAAMPDAVPRPNVPGRDEASSGTSKAHAQGETPQHGETRGMASGLINSADPFFVETPASEETASKADAASEQSRDFTLRAADRGGLISLNAADINAMTVVFRQVDAHDDSGDDPE